MTNPNDDERRGLDGSRWRSWVFHPSRLARIFAMNFGSAGGVLIIGGMARHSDAMLLSGVFLFFPGLWVALRTEAPPPPKPDDVPARFRFNVAAERELSRREKRTLLLGALALMSVVLIVVGALSNGRDAMVVGGVGVLGVLVGSARLGK